jgi:rod shape-determining protein MreC
MVRVNLKKYILISAAIMLLIFLHYLNFLKPAETLIFKIFNPALVKLHSASLNIKSMFNSQNDKRDLIELLKQKEKEANNLIIENARLKSFEEENRILRQFLEFSKKEQRKFILGNVISGVNQADAGLDGMATIDKGSANGVKPGAAVLDAQGFIVGKVIQVKDNFSEICLITNKECKLAAALENENKTAGIIRGEHGLTIKMEFIPQTEEVKEGDIVITSGIEEDIPAGLVIGKIIKIDKESNELWQSAVVEPLVNLNNLAVVAVPL